MLQALEDRLADARRDLLRADGPEHEARIRDDIALLETQVEAQRRVVADPEGASRRTEQSIAAGLERERQPAKPVGGASRTRFLNPPPAVAPTYFQNRHIETQLIGDFLKDESKRLMTIVGRGGIGKTATVCRVLKALERGSLPGDLGPLDVEGIIYLSAIGSRRVNAPHFYEDLLALLPPDVSRRAEAIVRDARARPEAKMRALLEAFPAGRTLVLLDNFEDVVDPATHAITDAELDEALRALLTLPHHGVKVVLTTRIAPRALNLREPGRQSRLDLDDGLESPYAETILREMDADGKLGLRAAPDALLSRARAGTRGFPRALEALAAILAVDRDTTLEEILDRASTLLPDEVTHALVGDAFSRLDPIAQRVMQALAIYGRPVPPAALDYLLQPHQPGIDSAPVLARLVNMHFARKETGRYYLHPVDREYALSRLTTGDPSDRKEDEPPFTRYGLLHRAAEYFEQARLPRESWKSIEDLWPQLAEFELRHDGQDYETAGWIITAISSDYLRLWGWNRVVAELIERLVSRVLSPRLRSWLFAEQGQAYLDLGQANRAISCHEQALDIDREVGDRRGEGIDLGNLGLAHAALGRAEQSIDYHEQALDIDREVGDRRGEVTDLGNLGARPYRDLGRAERAIGYYEQALAIAREVGDRRGEGAALGSLGSAYAALGQTERAIGYHEQALAMYREVGDRRGEGVCLGYLGLAHASLGRFERAIGLYEQALAIHREVGDQRNEGRFLRERSWIDIAEGRYEDATTRARDAVRIGEETGDPAIVSRGNGNLALALVGLGDLPGARDAAESARRHDVPLNNHNILALLGLIALRQGDRAAATEAFSAAVAHADVMFDRCRENYNALDARGLALAGLAVLEGGHRAAEASAAYRAARGITTAAGIVGRVRLLLELLAPADAEGILAGVAKAAEGRRGGRPGQRGRGGRGAG